MLDPIPRVCLVWNWKTRKNSSRKAHFWPKSPRVVSWESKTNSSGGLRWCEVNCSRHKAHNGLGLEVNSNLLMGSPHLAPLPEFVRHSPHATSVITRELQSCEITGTAPLLLFLILCLFFLFFCFPQTVSPSSPANSPQLSTPPFSEKAHFLMWSKFYSANRCCERPNMWTEWQKGECSSWGKQNLRFQSHSPLPAFPARLSRDIQKHRCGANTNTHPLY